MMRGADSTGRSAWEATASRKRVCSAVPVSPKTCQRTARDGRAVAPAARDG